MQEIIPAANKLAQLHLVGSAALHLPLTQAAARYDTCMQPIALVMSCVVVALCMCYGLDGNDSIPLAGMGQPVAAWGEWARDNVTKASRAMVWPMSLEQVRDHPEQFGSCKHALRCRH